MPGILNGAGAIDWIVPFGRADWATFQARASEGSFDPGAGLAIRVANAVRSWICGAGRPSLPGGRTLVASEAAADISGRAGSAPLSEARASFHALIIPHLDAAYNFARYLSRDPDGAHDIVQEAFLRAYRNYAAFRGGDARAWLFAILRNCHHDWQLRRRRVSRMELDPGPAPDGDDPFASSVSNIASDDDTPEAALIRQGETDRVRAVLFGLPSALREILVLREFEEFSYREIAEVAGLPIGTVMSRLARARRAFADAWSRADHDGETP